ncbi:hypothetical protein RND81_04G108700 [Saponaria officinalis]|uniref:CCHC-type domain-containing protein n=1 Tax=Saponaria officinalis TaxID=3572 RepID=A0AAW1LMY2_SAPOF
MHFLLTALKVVYVLSTPMPEIVDDETLAEVQRKRNKWENDDYIYRGHILNGMSDSLFDIYQNVESARDLWNQLESKYMDEDASSKNFLVGNFMNYKMVDSRPVMEQYNELLRILGQFAQHKMEMDESISVSSISDKLPPSWKDFKHVLKHKKEDLSLIQLGSHLLIEESLRAQDGGIGKGKDVMGSSSVNMMEKGEGSKNKFKGKKRPFNNTNDEFGKAPKGPCWICGKTGHLKANCKVGKHKKKKGDSTHQVGQRSNDQGPPTNQDIVAWWIDSGATNHVCKDRLWFKDYELVKDGSVLYMGNESTTPIVGRGMVVLEFSSGNIIKLCNVLHVPGIRKNLFSGSCLCKLGYKQVYESNKYVLSKHGVFIGFGYYCNGMFMLNVVSNKNSIFTTSMVDTSYLWYVRLGHVHYKILETMSKDGLIPSFNMNINKCNTSMLTAYYLLNRIPNKRNNDTPYELWYKKKPTLSYLRVWGCRAVVRLPDPKIKTLVERGIDCIFIGYAAHSKAYRFYVIEPNDSVAVHTVIESRDAIFDESRFSSMPKPKDLVPSSSKAIKGSDNVTTQEATPEIRRSKRGRIAKSFGPEFHTYLVEGSRDECENFYPYYFHIDEDPKTFDEAMKSHDSSFWKEAVNDEIDSIIGQQHLGACRSTPWLQTIGLQVDLQEEDENMGEADVILGIKIKRENKGFSLTQSHYIENVLMKFNHGNCSPVSTPMDPSVKLMPNKGEAISQLEYSQVIGCLMYAITSTRPDIAFVVGKLSRYTTNPSLEHWVAVKRVLRYLKQTMDYGLNYVGFPSVLEGYSDASWITNMEDHSSTSGWVFLLGGGAISWASKKQTSAAGKEAERLRNLVYEISVWPRPIPPISIHCDSSATLAKAYSEVYNGKSRHLGVRHSAVRELITHGIISVDFVRTHHNLADHLTKGLAKDLVRKSVIGMGLKSV